MKIIAINKAIVTNDTGKEEKNNERHKFLRLTKSIEQNHHSSFKKYFF